MMTESSEPSKSQIYHVDLIHGTKHYFGKDYQNKPCLIMETNFKYQPANELDFVTSSISLLYVKNLIVKASPEKCIENACIIKCLVDHDEYVDYFKTFAEKIANKHPDQTSFVLIKNELDLLKQLFSSLTKSDGNLTGLWGELCCIFQSYDMEFMVNSWHETKTSKWDFSFEESKVEVKTFSGTKREHKFSYEQLTPSKNTSLIVVSVYAEKSSNGITILELKDKILQQISSYELKEKLERLVLDTIGSQINNVKDIKFNLQTSLSELQIFCFNEIPKIHAGNSIDKGVSKITFSSNLEGIKEIDKNNANKFTPLLIG